MNILDPKNIKIAYIGGGSRGWAWKLMKDLACEKDVCGTVSLYDIDHAAACDNAKIGNCIALDSSEASPWRYTVAEIISEALKGAHFVIISILTGTFKEMESDVHAPEKYGVYQSVGDTIGPGGMIRALRTVPMFEEFARAIRDHAPNAWVINYTNPAAMCVGTLYRVFPQIKAFGCCHEVFGTQETLAMALAKEMGIPDVSRADMKCNVFGINHFTWLDKVSYRGTDLMPIYRRYAEKYRETGAPLRPALIQISREFQFNERVKFDLFFRCGYIAAAGDRHLAEFSPASWYLKDPETIESWGFHIPPVSWRWDDLDKRLVMARMLLSHHSKMKLALSGEEGVRQIKALMGLEDLVTNVNLPNVGQIPNLPLGTIVETNAAFTADSVLPVTASPLPVPVLELVARPAQNQTDIVTAALHRSLKEAYAVFCRERLLDALAERDKRALFDEMIAATRPYLLDYN